ncbi:MAG TPA: alpha/beta fold hydrolase [Chroococcales cyanobacterium]
MPERCSEYFGKERALSLIMAALTFGCAGEFSAAVTGMGTPALAEAEPASAPAAADASDALVTRTRVEVLKGKPTFINWKPSVAPRAVLLCLHELGMHAGRFEDLGQRMARNGYDVYAMDLRGFGEWSSVKGHEGRMDLDNTMADVKEACTALKESHPDMPVFLLGEAMGGALALRAAETFPDLIQGTISAAPGGEHYKTTHNYMTVCHRLITGGPNKRFAYGKELIDNATPKQELRDDLQKDPSVRLDLAPRELMACQFFMYKTRNMARRITKTPVLIVQGQQDGESKPEGATKVYDRLGTKDKQMLSVSDGDHYVYEDKKVSDKTFTDTLSWLNSHLPGASPASQTKKES